MLVRDAAEDGAREAFPNGGRADWATARELKGDVARWAIDSYFGGASS